MPDCACDTCMLACKCGWQIDWLLCRLVSLNEVWIKDNNLRAHPFRQGIMPNLRVLLVDMGVHVV
jgi:hypothetical protein